MASFRAMLLYKICICYIFLTDVATLYDLSSFWKWFCGLLQMLQKVNCWVILKVDSNISRTQTTSCYLVWADKQTLLKRPFFWKSWNSWMHILMFFLGYWAYKVYFIQQDSKLHWWPFVCTSVTSSPFLSMAVPERETNGGCF